MDRFLAPWSHRSHVTPEGTESDEDSGDSRSLSRALQLEGDGTYEKLERGLLRSHSLSKEGLVIRHVPVRLVDVESTVWMIGVGVIVALNSILIGYEVDHPEPWCKDADFVFVILFTIELAFRLNEQREVFFVHPTDWKWNLFDFFVVIICVLDHTVFYFLSVDPAILRVLRILRIMRFLRLLRAFRELAIIAEGFFKSMESVTWIGTIMLVFIYGCAIFTTLLIGHSEPHQPDLQKWFGTLPTSMLTLFEMVTLEGWVEIMSSVMQHRGWGWSIFFCTFVMFTSYTCLALLTAIITDQTMVAIHEDLHHKAKVESERQRNHQEVVVEIFHELDQDNSGSLSQEELRRMLDDRHVETLLVSLGWSVKKDEIDELFHLLDLDGSGTIDLEEFALGFGRLHGHARSRDLYAVRKFMQLKLDSLEHKMEALTSGGALLSEPRRSASKTKDEVPGARKVQSRGLDASMDSAELLADEALEQALRAVARLRGDTKRLQRLFSAAAAAMCEDP